MNEPAYPFRISDDALFFQFDSVNDACIISKAIQFTPFAGNALLYNLALGDVLADGTLDDSTVSNNRDMNRVMATVFRALLVFFEHYPSKLVYFQGSDNKGTRTRLYRMVIARELDKAIHLFRIYGRGADDSIEEFTPNSDYIGFIFQRKLVEYGDVKKSNRLKDLTKSRKPLGRYRSIDELSEAKMEPAKEFIANIDMTLFKKNGLVE